MEEVTPVEQDQEEARRLPNCLWSALILVLVKARPASQSEAPQVQTKKAEETSGF